LRFLYPVARYIHHYFKSVNEHSIHSPFVYDFYLRYLKNKTATNETFEAIESNRKSLLQNSSSIEHRELGAGSKRLKGKAIPVSRLARYTLTPKRYSQLFYRIIKASGAETIIELGTNLGINTCYLAVANPSAQVFTFEGSPQIGALASNIFRREKLQNIRLIPGNIDEALPRTLQEIEKIDFAYLDANHRCEPTMRYFNQLLKLAHADSVFAIGDIYWSEEMGRAWKSIRNHERVSITLDLYYIGLVFFQSQPSKQHFLIRF